MTAVLLDTNVFAMVLFNDPKLKGPARAAISGATRPVVSAVSFFEIGQKARIGKWPEIAPFTSDLMQRAAEDGFDLLPIAPATALTAALLDWPHRDPFDRMIAAIAMHEGLTLISTDRVFQQLDLALVQA